MPFKRDYYTRVGPGKRPLFAAFDTETLGLGGKIVAATYMREGDLEPSIITQGDIAQKLFYVMCENNEYQWFAHNAQYDWRYLVDRLIEYRKDLQIYSRANNSIYMLILDLSDSYGPGKRLIMRDSMAIWVDSLKKFADQFCPELPKLPLDFEQEIFDAKNPKHIEYAKRDAEALLYSLMRFDDLLFETFDVHIRMTSSSCATAAWQRTLDKNTRYYHSKKQEDFVRRAYYGGIVFLTTTNLIEGAKTYDLNSSYPYAMRKYSYPYGLPIKTNFFSREMYGIYHVTLYCPDNIIIPIIPARDKNGIVWRTGIFETVTTNVELEFAMEHGYRILTIHEGYVYEEQVEPFVEYINKCELIRKQYKGQNLENIAKRMQNGCYGKFGSRRERQKFYGDLTDDEIEGAEMWGDFFVKTEISEDMQCMPAWAVFITARARLRLLTTIYDIGPENCIYGDTDSITVYPYIDLPTGSNYGDFKLEKSWIDFRARGPKVYAGRRVKSGEEIIDGAAKGMPRRTWQRDGVLAMVYNNVQSVNAVVKYQQLNSFVNVLRTKFTGQYDATRTLSSLDKSASWRRLPDGRVRPKSWQENENNQTEYHCISDAI